MSAMKDLLLFHIIHKLEAIMATQVETAAQITALTAQVSKIGGETRTLITRIEELTAALADAGNTAPEVETALAALAEQVGVVDLLVQDPDAPV
jgi:uncharacterized protein YoxC